MGNVGFLAFAQVNFEDIDVRFSPVDRAHRGALIPDASTWGDQISLTNFVLEKSN